ncbi:MAG TPA: IS110 family transposase [Steroidobacteraceae bacterium]|nr:IS110 family transposase [Steroidobacteraceae bacterium]
MRNVRFVGLDVHAESIAVAVAEPDGEVRSLGQIANEPEAVRRLIKKLGAARRLQAAYEAGPTGYVLQRQLSALGVRCEVIAPSLIPVKSGDRVKTDKRDAMKLARCLRAGDLTPVWVPDEAHEALRDLVRARLSAKRDQLRARQRLNKLLLRHGHRVAVGTTAWGSEHMRRLGYLRFENLALQEVERAGERLVRLEQALERVVAATPAAQRALIEALQSLRGVAKVTAITLVAEIGTFTRFAHARQLMGYSGAVPSEHSSGPRTRRGHITKCGNAHVRRVLIEAAWAYRHRPAVGPTLRRRQEAQSEAVKAIAWQAQHRLHARYRHLRARGKVHQQVVTAIGRELLGFIWAIAQQTERQHPQVQPLRQPAA